MVKYRDLVMEMLTHGDDCVQAAHSYFSGAVMSRLFSIEDHIDAHQFLSSRGEIIYEMVSDKMEGTIWPKRTRRSIR